MVSTSSARRGVGWIFKLVAGLALAIVLFLGVTALLNAYNYAIGTRTGMIDKLSTKGLACWTTEGQLAQASFARSGTLHSGNVSLDNTFYFSVPDHDIQKQIEAIPPGSPVTLEYHQKLFALDLPIPFFCLRRTQYEIVGVMPAPDYAPNQVPAKPPAKP
jgi:hypothetical protein